MQHPIRKTIDPALGSVLDQANLLVVICALRNLEQALGPTKMPGPSWWSEGGEPGGTALTRRATWPRENSRRFIKARNIRRKYGLIDTFIVANYDVVSDRLV